MQRRKNVPKAPRKLFVEARAKHFINRNHHLTTLPIDPFELYDINGWYLFTWKEARNVLQHPDPNKLKQTGAEARTSIPRGTSEFVTVYDDTIIPATRVRWTIAHEIGHIVLGHLKDFEVTALNRGGLSPEDYDVLEKEADLFAAELLTPFAVLRELNICRSYDIKTLCEVSNPAATNRERYIQWRTRGFDKHDRDVLTQFDLFIKEVTLCNPNRFEEVTLMDKPHKRTLKKITAIPAQLDANGRFTSCPQCGNNEFSDHARYCKICGLQLFNTCTNTYHSDLFYCGQKNPGDARHCEICGEVTYLYKNGLLSSWEEWREERARLQLDRRVVHGVSYPR